MVFDCDSDTGEGPTGFCPLGPVIRVAEATMTIGYVVIAVC